MKFMKYNFKLGTPTLQYFCVILVISFSPPEFIPEKTFFYFNIFLIYRPNYNKIKQIQ